MNEKILIIDREQDILTTMDAILTSEGYRIRSTQSYEKAIGIIQSEPFDLVIMDIGIRGGMGGHEAIRQIKKLDGNMEVIVLTGSVSIENAVKALRRKGAFDFLRMRFRSEQSGVDESALILQQNALLKIWENEEDLYEL